MKLVVFETDDCEKAAFERLQPHHLVLSTRAPLNTLAATKYRDAEAVCTFVNSDLRGDVLAHFPSLRLIATRSTGYDNIDLDYCQAHDITVCNVPGYGDATVAEHTFALLLSISRHIPAAVERTRRGDFSQMGLRGFDLRGKTLGVIGTGRIGRRVIEIATGFGMEILAFDVKPNDTAAKALGFRYSDFMDVLARSDVITLHVPATPQTDHMISDWEFAAMKAGVVLINTARGSIVDVSALVRALADKKVAAVGLDVLMAEPLLSDEAEIFRGDREHTDAMLRTLLADHVLLGFPNVIITPHIAYDTDGALRRLLDTTVTNIEEFARGHPQNVVSGPVSPPPHEPAARRDGKS